MNQRIEGRKTRRYSCCGPIEFRVQDWYTFTGKILNLSLEGCFIQPDQPTGYSVGDRLNLRFEIHHLTFLVQCIVRRVAPDGTLGVEILLLSDRTRTQLKDLIEELDSAEQ
jgi:PilZ domain